MFDSLELKSKAVSVFNFRKVDFRNYCYDTVGAYLKEFFDNKEILK